ncbi:MAG: hypothetical protein ACI8R4_002918 [Paracoccaceae bacterium]|jgi:hypothetical protein
MTRIFGSPNTGKVIALNRFRSGKTMSPIRQAEAYWNALREGVQVPRRTQIDPRGLENILEYAFVLERIAPGIARFRLAGSHLTDLAGMEVRGMPLTSFFTPAGRTQVGAVLEHVFDTPAVAELTLNSKARRKGRHQNKGEARMILLPLQSDLGDISRVLGVLIADGVTGDTPHRFDVTDVGLRSVNGLQPDQSAAPQPRREPATGFAENQQPLQGRASHLKLVL